MSFTVHVCQDLKEFVVPLQLPDMKIHVFYTKFVKFVKHLLSRFVKNDSFMKKTKLLPKEEIIQAINQKEKCKVIIHIFISQILCSFYIFTNTFFVLIFENLFPNSSFCPFVAMINQHIPLLRPQKSSPTFTYLR